MVLIRCNTISKSEGYKEKYNVLSDKFNELQIRKRHRGSNPTSRSPKSSIRGNQRRPWFYMVPTSDFQGTTALEDVLNNIKYATFEGIAPPFTSSFAPNGMLFSTNSGFNSVLQNGISTARPITNDENYPNLKTDETTTKIDKTFYSEKLRLKDSKDKRTPDKTVEKGKNEDVKRKFKYNFFKFLIPWSKRNDTLHAGIEHHKKLYQHVTSLVKHDQIELKEKSSKKLVTNAVKVTKKHIETKTNKVPKITSKRHERSVEKLNDDQEQDKSLNMKPNSNIYDQLSNKLAYKDFVDGFKYYLKFEKDMANSNFSDMVRYQAHRLHSVDDIGKFILEKLPQVNTKTNDNLFDSTEEPPFELTNPLTQLNITTRYLDIMSGRTFDTQTESKIPYSFKILKKHFQSEGRKPSWLSKKSMDSMLHRRARRGLRNSESKATIKATTIVSAAAHKGPLKKTHVQAKDAFPVTQKLIGFQTTKFFKSNHLKLKDSTKNVGFAKVTLVESSKPAKKSFLDLFKIHKTKRDSDERLRAERDNKFNILNRIRGFFAVTTEPKTTVRPKPLTAYNLFGSTKGRYEPGRNDYGDIMENFKKPSDGFRPHRTTLFSFIDEYDVEQKNNVPSDNTFEKTTPVVTGLREALNDLQKTHEDTARRLQSIMNSQMKQKNERRTKPVTFDNVKTDIWDKYPATTDINTQSALYNDFSPDLKYVDEFIKNLQETSSQGPPTKLTAEKKQKSSVDESVHWKTDEPEVKNNIQYYDYGSTISTHSNKTNDPENKLFMDVPSTVKVLRSTNIPIQEYKENTRRDTRFYTKELDKRRGKNKVVINASSLLVITDTTSIKTNKHDDELHDKMNNHQKPKSEHLSTIKDSDIGLEYGFRPFQTHNRLLYEPFKNKNSKTTNIISSSTKKTTYTRTGKQGHKTSVSTDSIPRPKLKPVATNRIEWTKPKSMSTDKIEWPKLKSVPTDSIKWWPDSNSESVDRIHLPNRPSTEPYPATPVPHQLPTPWNFDGPAIDTLAIITKPPPTFDTMDMKDKFEQEFPEFDRDEKSLTLVGRVVKDWLDAHYPDLLAAKDKKINLGDKLEDSADKSNLVRIIKEWLNKIDNNNMRSTTDAIHKGTKLKTKKVKTQESCDKAEKEKPAMIDPKEKDKHSKLHKAKDKRPLHTHTEKDKHVKCYNAKYKTAEFKKKDKEKKPVYTELKPETKVNPDISTVKNENAAKSKLGEIEHDIISRIIKIWLDSLEHVPVKTTEAVAIKSSISNIGRTVKDWLQKTTKIGEITTVKANVDKALIYRTSGIYDNDYFTLYNYPDTTTQRDADFATGVPGLDKPYKKKTVNGYAKEHNQLTPKPKPVGNKNSEGAAEDKELLGKINKGSAEKKIQLQSPSGKLQIFRKYDIIHIRSGNNSPGNQTYSEIIAILKELAKDKKRELTTQHVGSLFNVTKTKRSRRHLPFTGTTANVKHEDVGYNVTPDPEMAEQGAHIKKRQTHEIHNVQNVAALEVIMDMKDDDEVHKTLERPPKNREVPNIVQVHIDVPKNEKKKRCVRRARKIFTANFSSPVDLEYQIKSYYDIIETSTPTRLVPGVYVLSNNHKSAEAPGPFMSSMTSMASNKELYELLQSPFFKPASNCFDSIETKITNGVQNGNIRLGKDVASALQLYERIDNNDAHTDGTTHSSQNSKVTLSNDLMGYVNQNESEFRFDKSKLNKRQAHLKIQKATRKFHTLNELAKKLKQGDNRIFPVTDESIYELICEITSLVEFMQEHCTEIQTFFWNNPSGGRKLRETVRKVNKLLDKYSKQAYPKKASSVDKKVTKRDISENNAIAHLNNNIQSSKFKVYVTENQNDGYNNLVSTVGTGNKGKGSNLDDKYALDQVRVNIICKAPDTITARTTQWFDLLTAVTLASSTQKRKWTFKDFLRHKKLNKLTDGCNKREVENDKSLNADTGGSFWSNYVRKLNHNNIRSSFETKPLFAESNITKNDINESSYSNHRDKKFVIVNSEIKRLEVNDKPATLKNSNSDKSENRLVTGFLMTATPTEPSILVNTIQTGANDINITNRYTNSTKKQMNSELLSSLKPNQGKMNDALTEVNNLNWENLTTSTKSLLLTYKTVQVKPNATKLTLFNFSKQANQNPTGHNISEAKQTNYFETSGITIDPIVHPTIFGNNNSTTFAYDKYGNNFATKIGKTVDNFFKEETKEVKYQPQSYKSYFLNKSDAVNHAQCMRDLLLSILQFETYRISRIQTIYRNRSLIGQTSGKGEKISELAGT